MAFDVCADLGVSQEQVRMNADCRGGGNWGPVGSQTELTHNVRVQSRISRCPSAIALLEKRPKGSDSFGMHVIGER